MLNLTAHRETVNLVQINKTHMYNRYKNESMASSFLGDTKIRLIYIHIPKFTPALQLEEVQFFFNNMVHHTHSATLFWCSEAKSLPCRSPDMIHHNFTYGGTEKGQFINLLGMYITLKTLKYMITADLKQYYQNMFGQRQNTNVISIYNTSHKVHIQNFTHVNFEWVGSNFCFSSIMYQILQHQTYFVAILITKL
jgi:hypothetical protein